MRPRIAILADRFPPAWGGGIASAHYHLFRILKKRGHHVRAFTYFDTISGQDGSDGIVRRTIPHALVRIIRRSCRLGFGLVEPGTADYQLADILIRSWGSFRLNGALRGFSPDIAIFPDHGAPGLWIRTPKSCRRIVVAHHNPFRFGSLDLLQTHSKKDIALAGAMERRVIGSADGVICPSRYMERVLLETHAFQGPVSVAHNMIDGAFLSAIRPIDPRPDLGLTAGAPLVYFPAGGNKFKGSSFVVDILERLAERHGFPLGVFVSGAIAPGLRKTLESISPHIRLFLPGTIDGEALIAVVKACSFAVYPTLVENYSMALLESVLCGVPVATFDVGGNSEIIRDGINGYLVPSYDAEALAEAAARLLDPDRLRAMQRSTSEDAAARLSDDVLAEAYEKALLGD